MELFSLFRFFKKTPQKSFGATLLNVDYSKFDNTCVRIITHLFMWAFVSGLTLLNLLIGYEYPIEISLVFMVRSLVCNAVVFYTVFYVIVPHLLLKKYLFWGLCSLLCCVYLWIFIDHLFMVLISKMDLTNMNPSRIKTIEKMRDTDIVRLFSIKNISSNLIFFLYSISPVFFIKVIYDLVRVFSKYAKTERLNAQLKVDNITIEKDFLKSQLNPHFLFNTLNNIYGLIIKREDSAANAVMVLSDMMRYTLYECNVERISLNKEMGAFQIVAIERKD